MNVPVPEERHRLRECAPVASIAHKLSLHQKPAKVPGRQFDIHRQRVEELWNEMIGA